jgi:hypothetical protein
MTSATSDEDGGASPDPVTSGGSAATQRNNGGNNNQRNRRKTVFKREIEELGNHVFTTPHEGPYNSHDYRKNMEAFELFFERTLLDPDDMICVLSNEQPEKLVTPEFLNMENLSEGEKILRGQEIKEFAKRDRLVRTNLKKAFTIIWAQCTPAMQSQIKGDREYGTSKLSSDCV